MSDQNKGWEMHITEMDLFTGLDLNVMGEIADACCVEENFSKNTVIFKEGDEAKFLYILVNGTVDLKIKGETTVYSLTEQSDIFGWSSMVENTQYTIQVIKIDTRKLNGLFNENPIFGLTVYRRLCGVFNKRLSSIYKRFLSVK
jgi:signal-transduction protein with cAMP-binding, CBS, and nucleotidyltransferase domain